MNPLRFAIILAASLGGMAAAADIPAEADDTRSTAPQVFEAFTKPLPLYPGEVTNTLHHIKIPDGPIAISEFAADIVEKNEAGEFVPVPLGDAYLHHHVVYSSHQHYKHMKRWWSPMKPKNANRGVGFGAGTESRGTHQVFPAPYRFATVLGENEMVANVHVINTRAMTRQQARHCLECPCTTEDYVDTTTKQQEESGGLFHWFSHSKEPKEHDNTTLLDSVIERRHHWNRCNPQLMNESNSACDPSTYYGGLICCEHGEFCLDDYYIEADRLNLADKTNEVRLPSKSINEAQSTFYLRYTLTYTPLSDSVVPLYLAACCDASGNLTSPGNIEYDIPQLCDENDDPSSPKCIHTLETVQELHGASATAFGTSQAKDEVDQWIDLVYMVGHLHRGGMEMTALVESTGEILCRSLPQYGNGSVGEIGNEPGYINAMPTCTFDPPRRMKTTEKIRVVGKYNATQAHTGVMSLFYVAVADVVIDSQEDVAAEASGTSFWKRFQPLSTLLAAAIVVFAAFHVTKRYKAGREGYEQLPSSGFAV